MKLTRPFSSYFISSPVKLNLKDRVRHLGTVKISEDEPKSEASINMGKIISAGPRKLKWEHPSKNLDT